MVQEQSLARHRAPRERRGSGPATDRSGLDRRTWSAGLALVLVAQLGAVTYLLGRSYFFAEDFTFLAVYQDQDVTAELLRTSVFGHLIPGFILVNKYVGTWFGASWTAAAVITVVVQAAGTVAFARLLVALQGRRSVSGLWLTAAFGLSVVVLYTAPWWAATVTIGVTLSAAVATWGCTLRYERSRRWRHLVGLALVYTTSVVFFEKAIVTSAYLGLFVLLVGIRDEDRLADRWRRAWRLWPAWLVIAVITVVDLAFYAAGPYLSESGEPARTSVVVEYLLRTFPEGTFPTLLGAVYPESTIPGPVPLTAVVATVVALAVVGWTSWRSRLARRAWLWYFLVSLVSQGVIARGRLSVFDVDIVVHNLRYQADTVYLFLLALAVAVPAALRQAAPVVRRRALVVAVVAPLLALPLWLQSVHTISTQSPGDDSKAYFAALRQDRVPDDAVFLDLPVSPYVIPPQMYPWNMADKVFPLVRPGTTIGHDPDGAVRITADGAVVPVELTDLTPPSDERVCVQGGATQTLLELGQAEHPVDDPLLLATDFRARGRAEVQLAVDDGSGPVEIRGTGELFDVEGTGALATVVFPPQWEKVTATVASGGPVCFSRVRLATVAP